MAAETAATTAAAAVAKKVHNHRQKASSGRERTTQFLCSLFVFDFLACQKKEKRCNPQNESESLCVCRPMLEEEH